MNRSLHRIAAAAALTLAAGLAQADVPSPYRITVLGTITDGRDIGGLFFGHETDTNMTDGEAFKVVFDVDTSRGRVYENRTLNEREIFGGALDGVSSPMSAVLTINGRTFTLNGDYDAGNGRYISTQTVQDIFGASVQDVAPPHVLYDFDTLNFRVLSFSHDFLGTLALDHPFSYTLQPGDQGTGSFNIQIPSPPGSIYNYYGAVGQLNVTSVSVGQLDVTPAVPEPASLLLCSAGLVVIAIAKRRRA